jgi:RNA-dependent RNA polymerase
MNHSLCEVKFKARIPVPKSYQLIGVADEGQASIKEGVNEEDVFTLGTGRIYGAFSSWVHGRATLCKRQHPVCVQEKANEPTTKVLQGHVMPKSGHSPWRRYVYMHSYSDTGGPHRSTVQRVYAVGEPPEDKICFFRGLKNVVVLPAVGAHQRNSCMPSLTGPPSRGASTGIMLCQRRFGWVRIYMAGPLKCSQSSIDRTTSTMII